MDRQKVTLDRVMADCRQLLEIGAALHWLKPMQKRPIREKWADAPVHSLDSLKASYVDGANIGIRLGEPSKSDAGYIHLIDLDIRDPSLASDAHAALSKLLQNYNSLPSVVSGSGGESRHYYFLTDRPFRKTKLAKSKTWKMVYDHRLNRDVKKNDWEIDLLGTGSQAVIPPSIHPDTKLPYKWERPFDFDMLALGIGPTVDSDVISGLGAVGADENEMFDEDEDDLLADWRASPLTMEDAEIDKVLEDLPSEWVEDRDTWYQVGMALNHQYQRDEKGFDKWCEWSQQSEKYDPKTQKSVWKSFKRDKRPITMRTLIKEANEVRVRNALPEVVPEKPETSENDASGQYFSADLADLLGTSSLPDPTSTEEDDNWVSLLDRNEEGHPKGVLHNIKLIVQNDIRTKSILALNEFTHDIVLMMRPKTVSKKRDSAKPVVNLTGPLWQADDPVNGTLWTDSHDHAVRGMIEAPKTQGGYGVKVSDRDLKAAVDGVANMQRFHPVRAYLDECAKHHDGVFGRCERLFIDYLGAPDTPYSREIGKLFCLGAVVRAFEPGHKYDFVVILEGLQGKRKSTFIRTLARYWFAELTGDFHNNAQMVENIQGAWIIEIPELQGFSRADTNTLKGFISRVVDRARLAYDRRARNFPRQCVFMGSTNDDEYLRDHTGGRRFWPIKCEVSGSIDTDRLEREVDQIWAEATMLYRQMRENCKLKELPLYLQSEEAISEAEELQESRRVDTAEDVLSSRVQAWLDEPVGPVNDDDDLDPTAPQKKRDFVCAMQVWVELEKGDPAKFGPAESARIGKALGRLKGFRKMKWRPYTKKYGQQRVYMRNGAEIPVTFSEF